MRGWGLFPMFTFDTCNVGATFKKSHLRSVCVCVSLFLWLWSTLHKITISKASDPQRDRTTALWISQSPTSSKLNTSVCVCGCTHCSYGCAHPTTSTVSPALHWVSLHFLIDPVNIMCDAGVDPRLVLLSAAVAPADYAHQSHSAIAGTDQWATRVSLWGHKKRSRDEKSFLQLLKHQKKMNSAHKTIGIFSPCRRRPGLVCHQRTACWKSRCVQTELLGCNALQATVARNLSWCAWRTLGKLSRGRMFV